MDVISKDDMKRSIAQQIILVCITRAGISKSTMMIEGLLATTKNTKILEKQIIELYFSKICRVRTLMCHMIMV